MVVLDLAQLCSVAAGQNERLRNSLELKKVLNAVAEGAPAMKEPVKVALPRIGTTPTQPDFEFKDDALHTVIRKVMVTKLLEVIKRDEQQVCNPRLIRVRGPAIGKSHALYQAVCALRSQPDCYRVIYIQDCAQLQQCSNHIAEFLVREVINAFYREIQEELKLRDESYVPKEGDDVLIMERINEAMSETDDETKSIHVRALFEDLARRCQDQNKLLIVVTDHHDALSSTEPRLHSPQADQANMPRFGCKCDPSTSLEGDTQSSLFMTLKALPRFLSGFPSVIVQMMSSQYIEAPFKKTHDPLTGSAIRMELKFIDGYTDEELELFLKDNNITITKEETKIRLKSLTGKIARELQYIFKNPKETLEDTLDEYEKLRYLELIAVHRRFAQYIIDNFHEQGLASLNRCVSALQWVYPADQLDLPYIFSSTLLFDDPSLPGRVRAVSDLAKRAVSFLHPDSVNRFTYVPPTVPLTDDQYKMRTEGLGYMSVLDDKFIMNRIFRKYFQEKDLMHAQQISKAFYILCNEEPLWKAICITKFNGDFIFKASWKWTALAPRILEKPLPFPTRLAVTNYPSFWLYKKWYRCYMPVGPLSAVPKEHIERRDADTLSLEEFIEKYEKPRKPLIITNAMKNWPARHDWQKMSFVERWTYNIFNVDEVDDEGRKMHMRLLDYAIYADQTHDEDPIYLFDPHFGERNPELLTNYEIPIYFRQDFFSLMCDTPKAKKERPPFQWICWGPTRSGSSFHIDPNGTSAWNAVTCGLKRWALYPPGPAPPGVKTRLKSTGEISHSAPYPLRWYLETYPFLPEDAKPLEVLQRPGEIIFVPSGWWHQVLNIGDTIAVTQNYLNEQNFQYGLADMLHGDFDSRVQLKLLYDRMKDNYPHLFAGVDPKRITKRPPRYVGSSSDSSSDSSDSSTDSDEAVFDSTSEEEEEDSRETTDSEESATEDPSTTTALVTPDVIGTTEAEAKSVASSTAEDCI